MIYPRPPSQVFIVRIWIERREIEGAAPLWRGEIINVISGERRYVDSLKDIESFYRFCLAQMGVKVERAEE